MRTPLMKWSQHFVVMATHPSHPNYSMQARGRKIHLAPTHKRNSKTLCNMLVVEGVEAEGSYADRNLCSTCQNNAEAIIDKRFNKTTYSFTINTDASYYPMHGGVSAWAAWIKSTHYTIKQAGVLPEGVALNSSMAEVLAVEQALILLDNLISVEPFLQDQKILLYFNTDSRFTIMALGNNLRRTKYKDLVERVSGMAARYEIVPRHVKGHTRGAQKAREWVNNWCDQQARSLANNRWRELDARAKEKV